jgi:replicative DNA helicase
MNIPLTVKMSTNDCLYLTKIQNLTEEIRQINTQNQETNIITVKQHLTVKTLFKRF